MHRLGSVGGRACLLLGEGEGAEIADLERASRGRLPADPRAAVARFAEVRELAERGVAGDALLDPAKLGAPVPEPRQVFGIGLNYRDHAEEGGREPPSFPLVFTKFPSCLAGPRSDVPLPSDRADWEVELVVVVGRGGHRIPAERALEHVAGCCVGQDISERRVQFRGRPPQFSLGKSFPGFGPCGPGITFLPDLPASLDLAIRCRIGGELVQDGRTGEMIFGVPELVEAISSACRLEAGDLIFTGTPAGVGSLRKPPRYLAPGDVIESEIEGLGRLVNRCVAAAG